MTFPTRNDLGMIPKNWHTVTGHSICISFTRCGYIHEIISVHQKGTWQRSLQQHQNDQTVPVSAKRRPAITCTELFSYPTSQRGQTPHVKEHAILEENVFYGKYGKRTSSHLRCDKLHLVLQKYCKPNDSESRRNCVTCRSLTKSHVSSAQSCGHYLLCLFTYILLINIAPDNRMDDRGSILGIGKEFFL
jgi:hypothetical protein